jgi:hypothetical protein
MAPASSMFTVRHSMYFTNVSLKGKISAQETALFFQAIAIRGL